MIVLIDGACGVGKSTVALEMQRILKDGTAVLDSDREFCNFANDVIEKDGDVCQVVSGVRGSVEFQRDFCEKLLHIEKTGVIVIVPMALDSNLCKVFFDKVLSERSHNYTHFLLTANRETIINRINNDNTNNRESDREYQILRLDNQVGYLEKNYPDAIEINTETVSSFDVAERIVGIIREL